MKTDIIIYGSKFASNRTATIYTWDNIIYSDAITYDENGNLKCSWIPDAMISHVGGV
jgi:hypothetical protein